MRELDGVEQLGDGLADRLPVRLGLVARLTDRVLQGAHSRGIGQFGQAGAAQQRAQRRIAERRAVELAEMGVAAMAVEQQRIADVVQRRPVFPGGQRAPGVTGDLLIVLVQARAWVRPKSWSQRQRPRESRPCKTSKWGNAIRGRAIRKWPLFPADARRITRPGQCDAGHGKRCSLTAISAPTAGSLPGQRTPREIEISRIRKGLSGNGPALLPEPPLQAKGLLVAVPQNQHISRAPSRPTPVNPAPFRATNERALALTRKYS